MIQYSVFVLSIAIFVEIELRQKCHVTSLFGLSNDSKFTQLCGKAYNSHFLNTCKSPNAHNSCIWSLEGIRKSMFAQQKKCSVSQNTGHALYICLFSPLMLVLQMWLISNQNSFHLRWGHDFTWGISNTKQCIDFGFSLFTTDFYCCWITFRLFLRLEKLIILYIRGWSGARFSLGNSFSLLRNLLEQNCNLCSLINTLQKRWKLKELLPLNIFKSSICFT